MRTWELLNHSREERGQGEIRRRAPGLGGAQEVGAGGLFGLMG